MDYITTTNLRTQSSQLISTLKKGGSVSLIHRSKVVGVIKPKKEQKPFTKSDIDSLRQLAKDLHLPKTSYVERDRRYRVSLMEKYGKNIS
ncbi:MAG: hypothetical protein AAB532_02130 [Patescibacteria group bacterium]